MKGRVLILIGIIVWATIPLTRTSTCQLISWEVLRSNVYDETDEYWVLGKENNIVLYFTNYIFKASVRIYMNMSTHEGGYNIVEVRFNNKVEASLKVERKITEYCIDVPIEHVNKGSNYVQFLTTRGDVKVRIYKTIQMGYLPDPEITSVKYPAKVEYDEEFVIRIEAINNGGAAYGMLEVSFPDLGVEILGYESSMSTMLYEPGHSYWGSQKLMARYGTEEATLRYPVIVATGYLSNQRTCYLEVRLLMKSWGNIRFYTKFKCADFRGYFSPELSDPEQSSVRDQLNEYVYSYTLSTSETQPSETPQPSYNIILNCEVPGDLRVNTTSYALLTVKNPFANPETFKIVLKSFKKSDVKGSSATVSLNSFETRTVNMSFTPLVEGYVTLTFQVYRGMSVIQTYHKPINVKSSEKQGEGNVTGGEPGNQTVSGGNQTLQQGNVSSNNVTGSPPPINSTTPFTTPPQTPVETPRKIILLRWLLLALVILLMATLIVLFRRS